MIYYNFKDYEEFKELFGIVEHGNGVKSRKNKILLAMYKDKNVLHRYVNEQHTKWLKAFRDHMDSKISRTYNSNYANRTRNRPKWQMMYLCADERVDRLYRFDMHHVYGLLDHTSMSTLTFKLIHNVLSNSSTYGTPVHKLYLNKWVFYSNLYETDGLNGLCEDGTLNAIRYRNIEKSRVYKMKAGRMFEHIMSCNMVVNALPEQIRRWLTEQFVAEWVQYARENIGTTEYELHVDDNFSDIYDPYCCAGYDEDSDSFGSCMVGDDQYYFYENAVRAKAAYLKDAEGMIVARCIVFTEVHEVGSDKIWRLAERQYSKHSRPELQRQLVAALINGGHIDGYKEVGASCGDSRKFVDVDGNSLESKRFWIRCELKDGDTLSYQDSFKWFDYDNQKADNYGYGEIDLATTDSEVSVERGNWSDYHDRYIDPDDSVWVNTRDDYLYDYECVDAYVYSSYGACYNEETCMERDCIQIGDAYYYAGHNAESPADYGIERCPECGNWFIPGREDSFYSDYTEEWYCREDCRDEADERCHKDNGDVWSEFDCEWFADEDDVITARRWRYGYRNGFCWYYEDLTISVESFNELVEDGKATEYCGVYYLDNVGNDGEPLHLASLGLNAA